MNNMDSGDDRFERRLVEETSKVRVEFADQAARIRVELADEAAGIRVELAGVEGRQADREGLSTRGADERQDRAVRRRSSTRDERMVVICEMTAASHR